MPKSSVGESFTVATISRIEKVWLRGGGGVSGFYVENFLSHSAENFRGGTFHCCKNFGYRKTLVKKGGSTKIFRRIFFVLQCRKFSLGNPLVFHCFRVTKKFGYAEGGV